MVTIASAQQKWYFLNVWCVFIVRVYVFVKSEKKINTIFI